MPQFIDNPLVKLLDKKCTERLDDFKVQKQAQKKSSPPWLCMRLVNTAMDEKGIKKALCDRELLDSCTAAERETLSETKVSFALNPPLGIALSSFTSASLELPHNIDPIPPAQCECQKFLACTTFNIEGHACGQATTLPASAKLHTLFAQGRKYRPTLPVEDIGPAVSTGVEKFVTRYFTHQTKERREVLVRSITKAIHKQYDYFNFSDEAEISGSVKKELRELYKSLVILPVDKTSHDLGFVCKHYYQHNLSQKLVNSSNYSVVEDQENKLQSHIQFCKKFSLQCPKTLPYMYGTLKLHKKTVSLRHICGVSRKNKPSCLSATTDERDSVSDAPTSSTLTDVQLDVTGCLKAVLKTLKKIDDKEFINTGVRRYWVVESTDEAVLQMKLNSRKLAGLDVRGNDFSTMYDQLPHADLKKELHQALDDAFSFWGENTVLSRQQIHGNSLQKKQRDFSFANTTQDKHVSYSKQDIKELITFCLDNTLVLQGQACYKQNNGIPMGANSSPDMANIYCHMKEKKYVDMLLANNQRDKALLLSNTMRYIDDLCTFGVDPPPPEVYCMEYKCTNNAYADVTFLGIRIRQEQHRRLPIAYLRLSVQDKSSAYPYKPLAYVSASSTAPISFASSIIIGACVRTARISNNIHDFRSELNNLLLKLFVRGHDVKTLEKGFKKWLLDYFPEYRFANFTGSIRKHFFWACKECVRIINAEDPCEKEAKTRAFLTEKPFLRYRQMLQPGFIPFQHSATCSSPQPHTNYARNVSPSPTTDFQPAPHDDTNTNDSPPPPTPSQTNTSTTEDTTTPTTTQLPTPPSPVADTLSKNTHVAQDTPLPNTPPLAPASPLVCEYCATSTTQNGKPFANEHGLRVHKSRCPKRPRICGVVRPSPNQDNEPDTKRAKATHTDTPPLTPCPPEDTPTTPPHVPNLREETPTSPVVVAASVEPLQQKTHTDTPPPTLCTPEDTPTTPLHVTSTQVDAPTSPVVVATSVEPLQQATNTSASSALSCNFCGTTTTVDGTPFASDSSVRAHQATCSKRPPQNKKVKKLMKKVKVAASEDPLQQTTQSNTSSALSCVYCGATTTADGTPFASDSSVRAHQATCSKRPSKNKRGKKLVKRVKKVNKQRASPTINAQTPLPNTPPLTPATPLVCEYCATSTTQKGESFANEQGLKIHRAQCPKRPRFCGVVRPSPNQDNEPDNKRTKTTHTDNPPPTPCTPNDTPTTPPHVTSTQEETPASPVVVAASVEPLQQKTTTSTSALSCSYCGATTTLRGAPFASDSSVRAHQATCSQRPSKKKTILRKKPVSQESSTTQHTDTTTPTNPHSTATKRSSQLDELPRKTVRMMEDTAADYCLPTGAEYVLQPIGCIPAIPNIFNNCYFVSVIHMLLGCPTLFSLVLNHTETDDIFSRPRRHRQRVRPTPHQLFGHVVNAYSAKDGEACAKHIQSLRSVIEGKVAAKATGDPSETLVRVINWLAKPLKDTHDNIWTLFSPTCSSTFTCAKCTHNTHAYLTQGVIVLQHTPQFMNSSTPSEDQFSIQSMVNDMQKGILSESSSCTLCGTKGHTRNEIVALPSELFFHIPRVHHKDGKFTYITHSLVPTLHLHIETKRYKLVSFICHNGHVDTGHLYTVKAMDDGQMVFINHLDISSPVATSPEMLENGFVYHYTAVEEDFV